MAAIGLAAPARDAFPAGKVRNDRHRLAAREQATGADFIDLAGQFMADDSRIFEIGLRALENMEVRAADASAAQPNSRLARLQRRLRPFDDFELAWLLAEQRSHGADFRPF